MEPPPITVTQTDIPTKRRPEGIKFEIAASIRIPDHFIDTGGVYHCTVMGGLASAFFSTRKRGIGGLRFRLVCYTFLGSMAGFNIMSWNVYGGDTDALAKALSGSHPKGPGVNLSLDLVILEEAQNKLSDPSFYNPLKALMPAYNIAGPYLENHSFLVLSNGKKLYAAQGVNRSYCILYKTASFAIQNAGLVNFATDASISCPSDPVLAGANGINQRPPLGIEVTHAGTNHNLVIFAWHAPVHPFTAQVIDMFDGSDTLAQAEKKTVRVMIAGDLNTQNVSKVFKAYSGIQDKFDFILGNFGTIKDLRTTVAGAGAILDDLWGDAHPAIAAEIVF